MWRNLTACAAAALVAAAALSGCTNSTVSLLEHAAAGRLTIGVKYDQPGLSEVGNDRIYRGFDIEVARYIAATLGVKQENITFKDVASADRESMISSGDVDFVVASYSINDDRKKRVGFAGPYLTAGQSLLIRKGENLVTGPESLGGGKWICSVEGSAPAQNLKKNYKDIHLQLRDTYSSCVHALRMRVVSAISSDDVILAGYAAQAPDEFALAGKTFSSEKYGIGVRKNDTQGRARINDAIEQMIRTGAWKSAYDAAFARSGYPAPPPPAVDRY